MEQDPQSCRSHERWAHFRFGVIGPLLAAPPERGQLQIQLSELDLELASLRRGSQKRADDAEAKMRPAFMRAATLRVLFHAMLNFSFFSTTRVAVRGFYTNRTGEVLRHPLREKDSPSNHALRGIGSGGDG